MAAAGGDDMHRDTSIKQHGFMRAPQVVQSQSLEPQLPCLAGEFLGDETRSERGHKRKVCQCRGIGESALGQFNQPQVDRQPIRPPAIIRKCFSRSARSSASRSSSIVMVRWWLCFLGPLKRMHGFSVSSAGLRSGFTEGPIPRSAWYL